MNLFVTTVSCLFLLTAPLVFAQNLDYSVSGPYPVVDANLKKYFAGNGKIMAVKAGGDRVTIQKWNAETLLETQRNEYNDFEDEFVAEGVHTVNGNYFLFYSILDRTNNQPQLLVREIDFGSGTFIGPGRQIINVEGKLTYFTYSSMNEEYYSKNMRDMYKKFSIKISYDKSKVLVQYRKKPSTQNDKKYNDVIGLFVFDDQMNTIHGHEVEMPYIAYKMDNIDYAVTNSGKAQMLTVVYDGIKKKRFDKDNNTSYHFELLQLRPDSDSPVFSTLEVEGLAITELMLASLPKDETICAGYFTHEESDDGVGGVVLLKLGEDGKTVDMKTYDIPPNVIKMYLSELVLNRLERRSENGKIELSGIIPKDIRILSDGSILMHGEEYFRIQHDHAYSYHYGDVLITKIDADNNLQWMQKLPKNQKGDRGKDGMSFKYLSNGSAHTYLFLDHADNIELAVNEMPTQHINLLGGVFTAFRLDSTTGESSRNSIFDLRDIRGYSLSQFSLDRYVQLSENEFCIEAYKGDGEDVMIKVFVEQ